MMFIKIHKSYRTVVALCDSELIGKTFEQDDKQLQLTENFYKDKEISKEQAIQILKEQAVEDATFNIVGQEAVQAAEEAGLIESEKAFKIQEIPYLLAF